MNTKELAPAKVQREKQAWLDCIEDLLNKVESWAKASGWEVARETKTLSEDALGDYEVPVLKLRATGGGIVFVEPEARYVIGADGRVDIYAWPTLQRLLLIRSKGQWQLKTDSGVPWPELWGKKTFASIVKSLTEA